MMEEENREDRLIASQDITDEMRIQFAIDELYEFMKRLCDEDPDDIDRTVIMCNNIMNMMDTYVKKFNNPLILKDYYERLDKARKNAKNIYDMFLNVIRVVQEFKGVQENISEKLAEQIFEQCKEWEREVQ